MTEPQQTRRHSPLRRQKVRISYICHKRIDANFTIASREISNESVGAKCTRNGYFFPRFSVSSARPERSLYGRYWDPTPERGVPWGYLSPSAYVNDELKCEMPLHLMDMTCARYITVMIQFIVIHLKNRVDYIVPSSSDSGLLAVIDVKKKNPELSYR